MRVRILPYGPSNSVNALKEGLFSQGVNALKLSTQGASRFRGREGDVIINWGNSTFGGRDVLGNATVLNSPEAVRRASMKTTAFETMVGASVSCVPHTTSREEAQDWLDNGSIVYSRTVLQGHSGEGIVVSHRGGQQGAVLGNESVVVSTELPQARLYTKGFTTQRREFRIHVMHGVVTYVQQKKRESGYQENLNYSNLIRNYHTGWIYATSDITPNQAALDNAIRAVGSLGLDFGAVDVITRGENAWVLEVNTAPGLQGTNLETYVNNFVSLINFGNVLVGPFQDTDVEEVASEGEAVNSLSDGPDYEVTRVDESDRPHDYHWDLEALLEGAPDRLAVSQGHIRGNIGNAITRTTVPLDWLDASAAPFVPPTSDRTVVQEGFWDTVAGARVGILRGASTTETVAPVVSEAPQHEGFIHEAFYVGTVNGQRMIVQFHSDVDGFYMPGWEIPLVNGEDGFEINSNQEPV